VKTFVLSTGDWDSSAGSSHEIILSSQFDGVGGNDAHITMKEKEKAAVGGVPGADTRSMLYSIRVSTLSIIL